MATEQKQQKKDAFQEAVDILSSYREGLPAEAAAQPCCAGCEEAEEKQWQKKNLKTKMSKSTSE